MPQNLEIAFYPVQMGALLLGIFGGLALVLAAIGLYGVIAFSVSRRTREIGIRMALGADRGDVLKMISREGLRLVLVGIGVGLVLAVAGTRLFASALYGVSPTDALTFGGTALVLMVVALAANLIPAQRAARVQPVTALRYE